MLFGAACVRFSNEEDGPETVEYIEVPGKDGVGERRGNVSKTLEVLEYCRLLGPAADVVVIQKMICCGEFPCWYTLAKYRLQKLAEERYKNWQNPKTGKVRIKYMSSGKNAVQEKSQKHWR